MSPRAISKLLQPLQRKLSQVVSRAVVRVVNDGLKMQELQLTVMADETLDGVERFQNYGFTSHPKDGAEAITLSVNGHRSHSVAVVVDDRRYRLKSLQAGEVAIYDDLGNVIKLGRDAVSIDAVNELNITAPQTNINGDVNITGDVTVTEDVLANGISLTGHTHPGDSGGTTGAPN